MLRGIGYLVADRGDKNVASETAACLELSGWMGRMLSRLTGYLPLSMRWMLGVKQPLRED
jgi:hypothetical protein